MTRTVDEGRPARVGIDEVALAVGVSRQTVSNVLNGRGRFADRTRDRVRDEVARLGYRPHRGARSLRSRRSMQLALPMTAALLRPGNVIMAQFLQACVAAAAERDHHVLVAAGADGGADGIRRLVADASVDAFLLADAGHGDPRVAALLAQGIPFACFGRTRPGEPQCWVDIDNVGAVRDAVAHLVGRGHRHLAYVGYGGPDFWNAEREQGFLEGLRDADLPGGARRIRRVQELTAVGVVDRLLAGQRPPTAVVTGSDTLAAVVYAAVARRGLVVGRDVAVTGVDGGALGSALVPSLTTVTIPLREIARAVVDRALAEVGGPTGRPGLVISGELSVGGSTAGRPAR